MPTAFTFKATIVTCLIIFGDGRVFVVVPVKLYPTRGVWNRWRHVVVVNQFYLLCSDILDVSGAILHWKGEYNLISDNITCLNIL